MVAAMMCWGVITSAAGETYYQRLMSFGSPQRSGAHPNAGLIQGNDGRLYGTTTGGGRGFGTVFTIDPDGSAYGVLHSFDGEDGAEPNARVIERTGSFMARRPQEVRTMRARSSS